MATLKTSHAIITKNTVINTSHTIVNIKKTSGKLRELLIVSPVKFKIYLMVDDVYLLRETSYDDLATVTTHISGKYISDISAFSVPGGLFAISIIDMGFLSNMQARIELDYNIYGNQSITINNIVCLYDLYKEVIFSTPLIRS